MALQLVMDDLPEELADLDSGDKDFVVQPDASASDDVESVISVDSNADVAGPSH